MDRLVAEEAPGDRDVLGRGRPVVTRDEVDDLDRSDLPFADPAPDLPVLGEGAAPEPDCDGHVGRGRFGDDGPHARKVEVDRLLAVGGLAGAERLAQQFDMGIGGGRDEDRVDRFRPPDGGGIGRRAGAVLSGDPLGGRTVDIADAHQLRSGVPGDVPGVDPAGPAGSEEGESNHGRLPSAEEAENGIRVRISRNPTLTPRSFEIVPRPRSPGGVPPGVDKPAAVPEPSAATGTDPEDRTHGRPRSHQRELQRRRLPRQ